MFNVFEPKLVDSLLYAMIEFFNHGIQDTATWSQLSFVPQVVLRNVRTDFNFSCELGQIMIRYDFLCARRMILSNVRTDLNFTEVHFWSTFHVNWGK